MTNDLNNNNSDVHTTNDHDYVPKENVGQNVNNGMEENAGWNANNGRDYYVLKIDTSEEILDKTSTMLHCLWLGEAER